MLHRVLVTGANGLVGQALVRRLSALPEVDLLATSREAEPRFSRHAGGYAPLDVTDGAAVRELFHDFAPSAVVHCAAMSKVEACEAERSACWAANVEATARLASACRSGGARLVLVSTDFVFPGLGGPYGEDDRPEPINFYGRSKLAAENAIRGSGLARWSVARTSLVFGAGEDLRRSNFPLWLAARLRAGEPTACAADQMRTPTFDDDLADGLWRIVQRGRDGVYHLAGRERLSVLDFAHRIAARYGLDERLLSATTTAALHPDAPRPTDGGLLTLRAETELGFRPTPLDAALDVVAGRAGFPAMREAP